MRMVVKVGGALLEHDRVLQSVARQVAELSRENPELLVVHGGGRTFTAILARLGIASRFVGGLRVTDRETRDVAVMVLGGLLNKRLTAAINRAGRPAVGVCASDAACFLAEPMKPGEAADNLGFVGQLSAVNVAFLESLWGAGLVPVAASLGLGSDGELYNLNADQMAAACARELGAERLIFLTDVGGVLDGSKVLETVSCGEIDRLIERRRVSGGMVVKLEACRDALAGGVQHVRIASGYSRRCLLAAARDDANVGTRITGDKSKVESRELKVNRAFDFQLSTFNS
jgi:acetylglutamate kinase